MSGGGRWGARFAGEACVRHKSRACPSCLAYALGDAREEADRLRERERVLKKDIETAHIAVALLTLAIPEERRVKILEQVRAESRCLMADAAPGEPQ